MTGAGTRGDGTRAGFLYKLYTGMEMKSKECGVRDRANMGENKTVIQCFSRDNQQFNQGKGERKTRIMRREAAELLCLA